MWDFTNAVDTYNRYLVVTTDTTPATPSPHFIVYGDLFTPDGQTPTGQAALLEAPTAEAAALLLPGAPEAHPWEFGGRR